MLTSLSIKNFGLIDQFEIEFFHRLNVITGETGAGKSILIDALRYVLGEKLHSSQIRNSDTQCSVEAVFELSKMQINEFAEFAEYISEEQPTLIILRIHLPDGRIKNKINGFRVTTSKLKLIGNHLIDFHGPYEHQLLFSEQAHIKILDRLCKIKETKNDYQQLYNAYLNLHNELHKIHQLYQQSQEQLDLLKHQIFELEQVPLDTKKYSEIIQEHTQLNNIERLNEHTRQLINTLDDEQTGLNKTIINAFGALKALNTIDQSTTTFTEILSRIQDDSSELLSSLHNYLEYMSCEPEKTS
ncbi:MAG: hypothetical protein DRP78_00880 [Candidatus Omnitrophota bacterium]|nr:MAG: hypothetical protein DRP78_00880 [Candidatus Omnitrophota bacterium]